MTVTTMILYRYFRPERADVLEDRSLVFSRPKIADGVDIRTTQLMLGHADIEQTQRYLNITDEELRKAMRGVWERPRQLRAVGQ